MKSNETTRNLSDDKMVTEVYSLQFLTNDKIADLHAYTHDFQCGNHTLRHCCMYIRITIIFEKW